MVEIQAVKAAAPDPKAGKPKPKSGVSFPYYNLEKSIEVAKIMQDRAGGVCDRAQLAALLGYSGIDNGSFLTRVAAAKMFGLIEQEAGNLRVSARGRAIIAPISEAQAERAKVEAFLSVDLFRKVFDLYNGQALPAEAGLKNLIGTQYNVVKDRVGPTVNIMLQSAEQAGLFKAAGRSRMVMPLLASESAASPLAAPGGVPTDLRGDPHKYDGGGEGGGSGGPNIHPAILGLLKELPPAGTPLSTKKRAALISAFTATVEWIYPDSAGDGV